MKVIDCIQGTPEWHEARCGRVTASRIADVMARTKTGYGAARANYMAELIAERLTGTVAESYTSAAMQRGSELEAEAINAYEFMQDVDVVSVGFVIAPGLEMAGASPDGLVGDEGLVEVKCPNTSTHIDTLLTGKIPQKYVDQMQWQMYCTYREWCDFVSYDPRLPQDLSLWIKRVKCDDKRVSELIEGVTEFLSDLDEKLAKLQALRAPETEAA
jgi:putative phage-type endonuclease